MRKHLFKGGLGASALIAAGAAAVSLAPSSASGAAYVPLSDTTCKGQLTSDPSGAAKGDDNLLDYSFSCDGAITAYTIIAHQDRALTGAIDDFQAGPSVFETDGVTPSPTSTVICSGAIPGNGINCNTGARDLSIPLDDVIQGTVDTVTPYCKHLPTTPDGKPAKPGLRATATARIQLLVTDATGAMDGPFALKLDKACPSVPDKVPAPTTTTSTTPTKGPGPSTRTAHSRAR